MFNGIQIRAYGFDLPPLFSKFFSKRMEKIVRNSRFEPFISLQFFKAGPTYHGELKVNDLDLSLGCFDQSEDILELFKDLEKEMVLKIDTCELRASFQNINF
ncbi:MAG: hypothetical protein ACHQYQ_01055 [Bacteriovoracales bacterium]